MTSRTEPLPQAAPAALSILLLEDSTFDAELLRAALQVHGPADARLTWVTSEEAFLAALAHGHFDIILSDYQIPGYSGLQALAQAQAACPDVPFIFVSGVIGEDNAVDLLKQGATDYVTKGRLARLPVAIERALAEAALRRARQAAEARLSQAKEDAERANRAKDRFLAMLSHELRTPLAPIASATHLLERCAVVPEKYAHLLPMIRRNVEIEARLIADLLDLSAIGAGKLVLHREAVDVHRLVHSVVQMLEDDIRKGDLHMHVHLDAPRSVVHGDEARLHQVLWNIVRNAVKFTPRGGHIHIDSINAGDELLVRCTDSGIGIDPAALPLVFVPFEQADAEIARRFGGLGLGLAIANGLVQRHDGRVQAHSDGRDRGATFTVHLPVLDQPADAAGARLASAPAAAPDHAVRLLLVEDNSDAAEALGLSLQALGYAVTHAATQAEALALGEQGGFDAVLTDLGLPDGTGLEVGRRFGQALPVVALSGFGTAIDRLASTQAGFAAHLVKPVAPDAVHEAVQQALKRRGAAPV